jgi:hypothetical protein
MEIFDGRDLNKLSVEVKVKRILILKEMGSVELMVAEAVVFGL